MMAITTVALGLLICSRVTVSHSPIVCLPQNSSSSAGGPDMSKKASKRDGGALYKGMAIKLSDIVVGDTLGKPQERAVGRGETEGARVGARARKAQQQPRRIGTRWRCRGRECARESESARERARARARVHARERETRRTGSLSVLISDCGGCAGRGQFASAICSMLVAADTSLRVNVWLTDGDALPPPFLSRRYRHLQPRADCSPQGERQVHGVEDPEEGAWHPRRRSASSHC